VEHSFEILEFNKICQKLAEQAASPLGAEAALKIQPSRDRQVVCRWQAETTEMRAILEFDQPLPLDGLLDVRSEVQRLKLPGSVLLIDELVRLRSTMNVAGQLENYFRPRRQKISALAEIIDPLHGLAQMQKEIDRCIDIQNGEIRDDASPELSRIRRQLLRVQRQARSSIEKLLRSYAAQGMLQEQVVAVRNGRLVLVVKDEYKRRIAGLVHDRSSTGSSAFIEPLETVQDNNQLRELEAEEHKEIERILARLTDTCRTFLADIVTNLDALQAFDLVFARAGLSLAMNAQAPEFTDEVELVLVQARHPLLMIRMGEARVVPLDLTLQGKDRICIISGPNAGGKTVALKTAGLLVLMARAGLHVPALPHSKIGSIERVFAAIGDEQSLDNDLSTFSSHLRRLQEIVEQANEKSLVLVDEIGSGTDPDEGSALAMAILDHLIRLSCLCVVTTHQSALKAYGYETPGVINGSMEFDVKTLQPSYRFRMGVPGSSYAFEIAQRLGLADELVNQARLRVGSQKDKFEGLILQLEAELQRAKELKQEASIKEVEYRGLSQLYHDKLQEIRKEEKRLKKQAVQEAESIIQDANAAVERAVQEIREQSASREAIRSAHTRIREQRDRIDEQRHKIRDAEKKTPPVSAEIAIGDSVRWEKLDTVAVVLTQPDKRGRVRIQAGTASLMVPFNELVRVSGKKAARGGMVKINLHDPDQSPRNEVDLRGLTAEEAIEQVERFIDSAILAGFHEIRIIHGKGGGKLRKEIGLYLRGNPQVIESRLGNWNEGDSGVTVVTLVKDQEQRQN